MKRCREARAGGRPVTRVFRRLATSLGLDKEIEMSDEVIQQPGSEPPQDSHAIVEAIEPEAIKTVRIQATLVAKLNLADFQNSVPVIREPAPDQRQ